MKRIVPMVLAGWLGLMPQVQRERAIPSSAVGTAAIAGRVLIELSGSPQPVRRARVTLESDALPKTQTTDTDTDGRYQFENLPAGIYYVRAEKAGFVPLVRDPRRAFERPAPVEIKVSETAKHDLWMVRGAALEGQIRLDTGGPAVNVIVSAVRFAYDANGRRPLAVRQARTDDRGRFRLHTLPAGEYYIDAAQDSLDALRQIPTPGSRPTAIARSYYPGAPRIEGGQTITLATGQEVTAIDFTLSTISTAALRGRIVDSTGKPVALMAPRLQRIGGPVGEVRGVSLPDRGDFTYPSVPPGDYWLMGVARPSPSADLEFAAVKITVGGQDMVNLVLTTAKGAVVNGRVEVEGGPPLALNSLQVIAHETEFELPPLPGTPTLGVSPAPVGPDGTFSFNGLFGPRLLRFNRLPDGWELKRTLLDIADVTDTPVDFKGTGTPRTLRILITSRTSSVSGVVRDDAGRAMSGARVVIFGDDEQAWRFRSRVIKATESGADGRYTIEGLLDGKYHIVAVPYLEEGSWMDAGVLRSLQPKASPLAVAEAVKSTMNLVMKQ
jgi:Carboxypeptidase regulatory-like domain